MKKNIFLKAFLIINFFINFILNASNKENFNNFEKFSFRMSLTPAQYSYSIISKDGDKYSTQLNVGNYLAFMPSRYAAVNVYEFLSDVLQRDFKIVKINKKGKITDESKIIKYDSNNFFSNYQKGVTSEKAELKSLGMVFAGVKITSSGEYKITAYGNKGISGGIDSDGLNWLNLALIPTNTAFYIKMIDEKKIVWSQNRDYNSIQYTFNIENGKIVALDKKGKDYLTIHQNDNSLFVDMQKYHLEFRVNQVKSQLEYWINNKLKYVEKFQFVN